MASCLGSQLRVQAETRNWDSSPRSSVATEGTTRLVALSCQILETIDQLKDEHQAPGEALEQLEANTRRLIEPVTQFNARIEQAGVLADTVLHLE